MYILLANFYNAYSVISKNKLTNKTAFRSYLHVLHIVLRLKIWAILPVGNKQAFFACVYMAGFDQVYSFIKANSNVFLSESIIKRDNL